MSLWRHGGTTRRVTGIVQNPQSLLDEFALVVPGQVTAPSQVTVLFDARGGAPATSGRTCPRRSSASSGNVLNPETIVLALATVGMLLIALVGIGGFTVLAQRRLRSLGLLAAQGATDRNIRLVIRANGVLVGVLGAVLGFVLGLAAWLAYRPSVETDAHHLIGPFQLPWTVIGVAMGLAVVATYFAASRPARAITRIPIVTALSGRPAPPKQVHRSALPGLILLGGAAVLFAYSGTTNGNGTGALALVGGFVALIAAVILLAPACLTLLARLGRWAPIATRLALRDLARYRARSGSALAAITLGVLIAMLVSVLSAQRFGNVLDYAGPNLASDQLIVYTPNGQGGGPGNGPSGPVTAEQRWRRWRRRRTASRPRSARTTSSNSSRPVPRCTTRRPGAVVRAGLCRHPAAAPGLWHQCLAGQPQRRHSQHAARAVRPHQDATRVRQLLQPQSARAAARRRSRRTAILPLPEK